MKLLYVDIDGPLSTEGCDETIVKTKWSNFMYRWNPICVKILNEITTETGAEIVLSSDWRNQFTLEELGEIFEWNGIIKKPIAITGKECVSLTNLEKNRIHQITLSLDEHKPEKWVSFDDLFLGQKHYEEGLINFVLIDPIVGIAGEGIKQEILNFLI